MSQPILLFKTNYLGDAVTFLPTVAGVRRVRPNAEITVICSSATAPLYRATFPGIDLIPIDRGAVNGWRSLRHLPSLAAALRRRHAGWALLSPDEPSFCLLAARASGAPHRVGFNLINSRLHPVLTTRLPVTLGRNMIDLNFDLVRALAGDPTLEPERTPIGISDADRQNVQTRLEAIGIPSDRPLVLLHPFAKFPYRQWPLDRFADLAARIAARGTTPVVLSADPIGDVGPARPIFGLALTELAALCARAVLFIGNNSGPMHIAAAMGTPTLVLQGASSIEWNIPWGPAGFHRRAMVAGLACQPCERLGTVVDHCSNLSSPQACLLGLDVERVLADATAMLESLCPTR
jgi:ADP-heptose:LPS heptosyltransferase